MAFASFLEIYCSFTHFQFQSRLFSILKRQKKRIKRLRVWWGSRKFVILLPICPDGGTSLACDGELSDVKHSKWLAFGA